MDDGVKEDPAQSKEPKFLGKAGWMKKATGKMLAGYKDRFIHVEKTELKVYENEDLKICLEKLDLENYEKCLELRSVFSKKNRLVLIKTPKSGNKVHDLKFQAQTAEERDAWIKALREGINRAKNKIFDEVKIDENVNLNHVTRTRPKVNHTRRPPTRIHMKEVANVSSDGILRLDLDLENATIPNGAHLGEGDPTTETSDEARAHPVSNATEAEEPPTQKKVLKPPMPPSKGAKPSLTSEQEASQVDAIQKGPAPPMPPSKDAKPSENLSEMASPPASPGNSLSSSTDKAALARPPAPPSKDKKPLRADESGKAADKKEVAWIVTEVEPPAATATKTPPAGPEEPVAVGTAPSPGPSPAPASSSSAETQEEPLHGKMASAAETLPDASPADSPAASSASLPQAVVVVAASDPGPGREERLEEKSVDSGRHSEESEGDEDGEDPLAASTAALRGSQARLEEEEGVERGEEGQTRSASVPSKTGTVAAKPARKPRSASMGDLLGETSLSAAAASGGGDGGGGGDNDDWTALEQEVARELQQTGELLSSAALGESAPEDLLASAMAKLKMADRYLREAKNFKESKRAKCEEKRNSL